MMAAENLSETHVARMARALLLIADRAADGADEARQVLARLPAVFVAAARADMQAEELLSRGLQQQEAQLAAEELCREGSERR